MKKNKKTTVGFRWRQEQMVAGDACTFFHVERACYEEQHRKVVVNQTFMHISLYDNI
jgi:hypothetical protein